MLVGIAQEQGLIAAYKPASSGFNPCVGRNSSGACFFSGGSYWQSKVSIRVLVGIAQEPPQLLGHCRLDLVSIRVLVGIAQEHLHRSRGRFSCHVSIRVLVGIAQELWMGACQGSKNHVSIRVLVGIAQEL